jgi:hypothetical protein
MRCDMSLYKWKAWQGVMAWAHHGIRTWDGHDITNRRARARLVTDSNDNIVNVT